MNYFKNLKLGRGFTQSLENGFAFSKRARGTKPFFRAGFTLVEMIVVITIFTVLLSIMVINQNSWNMKLAVNTDALEVGLVLRQSQINSLAVRESTSSTGDKFDISYGVYFDINNNKNYIYFADLDGDSRYDVGEELSTMTLKNDITIYQICGSLPNFPHFYCSDTHGLSKIAILFRRPDSKADIKFLNSSGNVISSVFSPAYIRIRYRDSRAEGSHRSIIVQQNGQISN